MSRAGYLAVTGLFVVFALPGAASAADCAKGKPQVADPKGDATAFAFFPSGFPNTPSLDVLSANLAWDKKSTLTYTVRVDNLEDGAPSVSNGMLFRFDFGYGGAQYELTARSNTLNGTKIFGLYIQAGPTPTLLTDTLKGAFDSAKEQVRIVLPAALFNKHAAAYARANGGKVPPAMKKGELVGPFEILSQRYIGPGPAITATADTATGDCTYVIG